MFKFSLQRVLDLRAKREQETAITLSTAREAADHAREVCAVLEQAREHGAQRAAVAQQGSITVGQLQNLGVVLQCLDEHLASAREQANQADARVAKCMNEFTSASQDRRVLDRLREKHLHNWNAEEVLEDRRIMDEIALTRHVRSKAALNERSE